MNDIKELTDSDKQNLFSNFALVALIAFQKYERDVNSPEDVVQRFIELSDAIKSEYERIYGKKFEAPNKRNSDEQD
jgi:hypothetical protein